MLLVDERAPTDPSRSQWFRKCFGGGIRQSGGLAAAANYCLDHHLPLLAGTHELAAYLARNLADLGVHLMLPVETSELALRLHATLAIC